MLKKSRSSQADAWASIATDRASKSCTIFNLRGRYACAHENYATKFSGDDLISYLRDISFGMIFGGGNRPLLKTGR